MLTLLSFLFLAATPAIAAPTPEELALRAELERNPSEAIRILERDGDPHMRWIGGRLALREGNTGAARRLLDGADLGSAWGRIQLELERDPAAAAPLALAQMDEALQGTHRDAMAGMLVDWALERAPTDPDNAARFLTAAIGLQPSMAVQHRAEEALFRLPPELTRGQTAQSARARTTEDPDNIPARLRAATELIGQRPGTAADWFHVLIRDAEWDDAYAAAVRLSGMSIPDPIVLEGLNALAARFPVAAAHGLQLSHAIGLASRDERAGTAALDALVQIPELATQALTARAHATSDPKQRRAIWLDLATREGASALGDVARREALDALIASVEEIPDADLRRRAAVEALKTSDGAGKAPLLFHALPDGEARTDALWAHAARFPSGPWCDELAERLMTAGVDTAEAERFVERCASASGGRATLVRAQASETVELVLEPADGALKVAVATAKTLTISQHRVDEEALFRGTEGHPLDTVLDASLLEADQEWEIALKEGQAQQLSVSPRGGGRLMALTVRAGDRRATALVLPDPLEVQVVRRGADVAIAVLRRGAPVGGAELLVEDSAGEVRKARTDGRGIARLEGQQSSLRVMAQKGGSLGFAVSDQGGSPEPIDPTWTVVPWDRAISADGERARFQVFGTLPSGAVDGTRTLRSLARDGEVLDEVPVAIHGGVGRAELFAQGAGQLWLMQGDEVLAQTALESAGGGQRDLRVSFSDANPQPGGSLTARVIPLGPIPPGGIDGVVEVITPWSTERHAVSLTADGQAFAVDLRAAIGGEPVELQVSTVAGGSVVSSVRVASKRNTAVPEVPISAAAGAPLRVEAPDGSWLLASSPTGVRLWARADALVLPTPGLWTLCVWDDFCGPQVPVLVAEGPVDAEGRWQGEPVLVALTAEGIREARILREGDAMAAPRTQAPGTRSAWITPAIQAPALPVRGLAEPEIAIAGEPVRGKGALNIGAGLPEGTRLWAFLRDASDTRGPRGAIDVEQPWNGEAGWQGDPWASEEVWGAEIAAALLEEEQRLAEVSEMKRMDFDFDGAAETGSFGARGMGIGGGGSSFGGGGMGRMGAAAGRGRASIASRMVADPHSLGVIEDARPGALAFEIPGWVDAVDLDVVARTPDGRWNSRQVRLAVGGAPLVQLPVPEPTPLPARWSGDLADLVPVARALDGAARRYALAALDARGVPSARAPAMAAFAMGGDEGPSATLARAIRKLPPEEPIQASSALESLADVRLAERSDAAMAVAAAQPDRARAVAARLLADPELPAYGRVRAGLALWLAGDPSGAQSALTGSGPWIGAARAVIGGKGDPTHAAIWWRTAISDGAQPTERALALHALSLIGGHPVDASATDPGTADVGLSIEPPLASWHGATFDRRHYVRAGSPIPDLPTPTSAPRGRSLPVNILVPANALPTRLACAGQGGPTWTELEPSPIARTVHCQLDAEAVGAAQLSARWYAHDGALLGQASTPLTITAAADSAATDPMSAGEQLGLGTRLATLGDPSGLRLLEALLATAPLQANQTQQAASAILTGRRLAGDPAALIAAFQGYRERVPNGVLDLETASALAHAYADVGQPERAVAATQVVLDARFKEELGAVRTLQDGGLQLTALKLLRELLDRYPEVPTVINARFLAPSMLLQRADDDGDRLGYTRSSLQHTAAAELAAFLLLHPDASQAPEAAAMLTNALRTLRDPDRERALTGVLARRYREGPVAWRLSLAEAHAQLEAGNPSAAVKILEGLEPPGEGFTEVELERGRALDLLGRSKQAGEAYGNSGTPEAMDRGDWLVREELEVPPVLILKPGMPPVIDAHLRPGADVTVTAVRVNLEAVLLRDGGEVNADAINVQGLRPAANRTLKVSKTGDVPLPALAPGAYLVTVVTGTASGQMVLVITDAELVVGGITGAGTLVHLLDGRGDPLVDTQLWLFSGGAVETARTDGAGSAWVPFGNGAPTVLARAGNRYALALNDASAQYAPPRPAAQRSQAYKGLLEKNAMEYDALFQQDANQNVRADGL